MIKNGRNMNQGIKHNLEHMTADKRELQKKTSQMRRSWDEIQKIVGADRKKKK